MSSAGCSRAGTLRDLVSTPFLACLVGLAACGGDGNTGPGTTLGSVAVTASTTGEDADPDGYNVTLDGGASQALGINATTTFAGVEPGDHEVELGGVAANCGLAGANPRAVSVTAGAAAQARFEIVCTAIASQAAALAFTAEPGETELHQPLAAVEVTILDETGSPVPGAKNEVTVMLGANPGGATLSGMTTVSAVDGVARFEDLALDRRGSGYTLVVEAFGLEGHESEPFDVTFTWRELTVGGAHTCGRTVSGVAYCWGLNRTSQLGDGTGGERTESPVPVAVATDLRFAQMSAGLIHTCGVTPEDEVYCWGENGSGQLGDGRGGTSSSVPRLVGNGLLLQGVSAGNSYTCGWTRSGVAHCWGFNGNGQLGDNTFTSTDLPVAVDTDVTFSAVAAGHSHTCALAGTDAYCWGLNNLGQLGDATFDGSPVPVLVQGDHTFVEIGVGETHSCALTVFNEAFSWGSNGSGQLGIGTLARDTASVPLQVVGDIVFQVPSLSVGRDHTCAEGFGLGSFCWGENMAGQLGDGSSADIRDEPIGVVGGLEFAELYAGNLHTCGVTSVGEAFCWGANGNGQLGDGNPGEPRNAPVRVLDPPEGRVQ